VQFVTFADPQSAMQFYTNANVIGLTINHRRLKVGWGKHSGPLSPVQLQAIQSGATRNVYIGQIEDLSVLTEEKLRQDFAEYGGELLSIL
jgi:RNA recognition motif-containing protein